MKKIFTTLGVILSFYSFSQTQLFDTPGTQNFTVPTSVISMKVECVGAGGAGGRVTPANFADKDAAGGGGGGAYASSIQPVTQDSLYSLFVGSGGINDGSSVDGEDSYFGSMTMIVAAGGSTRSGNDNESGAQGGQASNSFGDIVFSGGNGGNGDEGDANGGGGGGAAGSNGAGFDGSEINGGGSQMNYGGTGGQGGPDGASGADGGNYGGGGGGSSANGSNDRDGGEGADGVVVLSWCTVSSIAPLEVCQGDNATITVSGTNFSSVDSVTLQGEVLNYSVINSTTIEITLSSQSASGQIQVHTANGSAQSLDTLDVKSESVAIEISGDNELSAVYTGNANSYQWIDCANGNSPISGATNESEVFNSNGVYAVEVNEGACAYTSDCFVFNSVNIQNGDDSSYKVYPNPVQNQLKVENASGQFSIVDVSGKVVLSGEIHTKIKTIDVSDLSSGIYFFKNNNRTVIIKK